MDQRLSRAISDGVEKRTKTGANRSVRSLALLAADLAGGDDAACRLVFPRRDGSPWTGDDWDNWRNRTFQANADAIGRLKERPYDLRRSFVSLLIAEGRTVIDVAGQAGHSPETCLRYCAHLFAEFDPGTRISAEELIRNAGLDAGGRSEDAGDDDAAAA